MPETSRGRAHIPILRTMEAPCQFRPKTDPMSTARKRRKGSMERRTFVIEAGKAFAVVIGALYPIGCSSSTSSPSTVADVTSTSTTVNGHTRSVNVPASDQLHPTDTTYTSLSHTHMVTLTAAQLATIASGGSVTVTSTASTVTGIHQHDFTFQGKES